MGGGWRGEQTKGKGNKGRGDAFLMRLLHTKIVERTLAALWHPGPPGRATGRATTPTRGAALGGGRSKADSLALFSRTGRRRPPAGEGGRDISRSILIGDRRKPSTLTRNNHACVVAAGKQADSFKHPIVTPTEPGHRALEAGFEHFRNKGNKGGAPVEIRAFRMR